MLNTIRALLGPYAGLLQMETLTSRGRGGNALADMAQLAGVRFVQSAELGADTKLASRVMKYLVQGSGSEIKAALKYGNPQRIQETWKCFIDCNELPDLEDPDDKAFLDRAHLIQFKQSVPPEKIDKNLSFESESSGILTWAARGFLLREAEGLQKPPVVVADLKRWREISDSTAAFLRDCCTRDPQSSVPAQGLYMIYRRWCERSLKQPASLQTFARRIGRRCRKRKTNKGLFYTGLKLLEAMVQEV
jgi:putative DNA primase/helicase